MKKLTRVTTLVMTFCISTVGAIAAEVPMYAVATDGSTSWSELENRVRQNCMQSSGHFAEESLRHFTANSLGFERGGVLVTASCSIESNKAPLVVGISEDENPDGLAVGDAAPYSGIFGQLEAGNRELYAQLAARGDATCKTIQGASARFKVIHAFNLSGLNLSNYFSNFKAFVGGTCK